MNTITLFVFSHNDWDENEAKVVCKMLGFNTEFAIATNGSMFGIFNKYRDNFYKNEIDCNGTEETLEDCSLTSGDLCDNRSQGAGVICYGSVGDPCSPSPCGKNAKCSAISDSGGVDCSCPDGLTGDPFISCRDLKKTASSYGAGGSGGHRSPQL